MRQEPLLTAERAGLGLLLLSASALYIWSSGRLPLMFDDAGYYGLARSLADGHGYWMDVRGFPERPLWPPGFPVLLSALLPWGGKWMLHLPVPVACLAAAAICFFLFGGERRGLLLAALVAFHPMTVVYSGLVMSEGPFLASVLGSLLCWRVHDTGGRPQYLWLSLGLALAALYVRTFGITVLAAVLAAEILRGRRPSPFHWAAAVLGSAPVLLLTQFGRGLGFLTVQPAVLLENAGVHLGKFPIDFLTGLLSGGISRSQSAGGLFLAKISASMAASALALLGFCLCLRRRVSALEIYALLYSGLMLLWPFYAHDPRFFLPLWPLFLYYMMTGLEKSGFSWQPAAVLLLVLSLSGDAALMAREGFWSRALPYYEGRYFGHYLSAFDWIKTHSDPGSVVYTYPRARAAAALYTGRRALFIHENLARMEAGSHLVLDYRCCSDHIRKVRLPGPGFSSVYSTEEPRLEVYRKYGP